MAMARLYNMHMGFASKWQALKKWVSLLFTLAVNDVDNFVHPHRMFPAYTLHNDC
jgi:hypothetical protein